MAKDYLNDIWDELSNGHVEERLLEDKKFKRGPAIHGYQEGKKVVVNPIPAVCDTLIHELFHRRYPSWSERYVKAQTTRLLRSMCPKEMEKLYNVYCGVKRNKRKLTLED